MTVASTTSNGLLLYRHRRERHDIAVRANVSQLSKIFVAGRKIICTTAVLVDPDKHDPRFLAIREIIGKGTDGLADVALVGKRRLTLDPIRLLIGKQFSYFLVCHGRIDFA